MTWLKPFMAVVIILHHVSFEDVDYVGAIGLFGDVAMYMFFAMSGYGLVTSYLHKPTYMDGFLNRSLKKLFIPLAIAIAIYTCYALSVGMNPWNNFCAGGVYALLPCSWFMYVLAGFYVAFFIVFRYVKANDLVKVLIVSALVLAYCFVAHSLGRSSHEYSRCPSFCLGMLFALYDMPIRTRVRPLWVMVLLLLMLCGSPFFFVHHAKLPDFFGVLAEYGTFYFTIMFFGVIYLWRSTKPGVFVTWLSGLSMEMYLVQGAAIDCIIRYLGIHHALWACVLVLSVDLVLALLVQKSTAWVKSYV